MENIDTSTNERICYSFFKYTKVSHTIQERELENSIEYKITEGSFDNIIMILNGMFMYLGIPIYDSMGLIMLNNKSPVIYEEFIKKGNTEVTHLPGSNRYRIKYSKKWNRAVYQFIKDTGQEDCILKIIEMSKNEISKLNSLIKLEEKNNQELLGF
ncbi:MAG: hypothetical protein ABFD66_00025 [Smithella sp.]